jgi:UDP-N-acetyl-D-galactosamine dehydrogenase
LTFKENCPDLRNTKVADLIRALEAYNTKVDVYDPWIDVDDAWREYGLRCLAEEPLKGRYQAIVLAVAHEEFLGIGIDGIKSWAQEGAVIFDVKSILPRNTTDGRL